MSILKHSFWGVLCVVCGISVLQATETEDMPDMIEGTTKVFAEDVLKLAETIDDLLIVDARIEIDRKQGFIEGSISLPDVNTNCKSLAKIIPTKTTPVLLYCNGVKCGRSAVSAKIALKCGYSKLYWFRGGFEEWKNKGFPSIKI